MSTILTRIDARHARLFEREPEAAAAVGQALERGDAAALHAALSAIYGDLEELILLGHERSILVWTDGLGTLAGEASNLPMLTYGYYGAGPKHFTTFLLCAGFSDCDAVAFEGPLLLRRDGGRETGTLDGRVLRWDDWTRTLIPPFPKARAPVLRDGVSVSCQACGRPVTVRLQPPGVAVVDASQLCQDIEEMALRCHECGFITCWRCARGETASVCPACHCRGGPTFITG